jgi:hypothetical protein
MEISMRHIARVALLATAVFTTTAIVQADVKTDEKSLVKFEGMLGRMIGLFGGKGAREGVVSTVAVKGTRKATLSEYSGQIVDLDEEKVYELDVRKKTYEVVTFAELRRRMEEARRKAEESAARSSGSAEEKRGSEPQKEMDVDFDLKESGQRKNVNGYDTREVIMTITVREKGKTVDQSGGLVLTSNAWLAPKIGAMKEVAEFDRKYFEKLQGLTGIGDAEAMATALAMFPGLQKAMARMRSENVNLDGTPILTTVKIEGVKNPEQMSQSREDSGGAPQASVGGAVLGGLRGRFGRKKEEKKDEKAEGKNSEGKNSEEKNRSTIMTMQHEVLKIGRGRRRPGRIQPEVVRGR